MGIADDIARAFREFNRYTGDGLPGAPVGAPLPVGDPQSGPYQPKKAEIRAALTGLLEEVDQADLAAAQAQTLRDQAQTFRNEALQFRNEAQAITEGEATAIVYDNDASGLAATTTQAAIDELAARPVPDQATEVGFNNTASNLAGAPATVQAAIDAAVQELRPGPGLPRAFLSGLQLANNASDLVNDIDIAPGEARDSADGADIVLAGTLTKRLDAAWAVGTGQGGLDAGSKAASTTYHVWLIKRTDTGVVDVLFSMAATEPMMPAGYDRRRRIGSVLTDGSGNIRRFVQAGTLFRIASVNAVTGSSNRSTSLLALSVPSGIRVRAKMTGRLQIAGQAVAEMLTGPGEVNGLQAIKLVTYGSNITTVAASEIEEITNTSRQIYLGVIGGTTQYVLDVFGWEDFGLTAGV
ncbi:MAG TPA: hypothetical protein VGU45_05025 [Microvirga sp.]|jgi:hypothetical protein|nr:hypothetical protein [Microvirga sp.]